VEFLLFLLFTAKSVIKTKQKKNVQKVKIVNDSRKTVVIHLLFIIFFYIFLRDLKIIFIVLLHIRKGHKEKKILIFTPEGDISDLKQLQ